MNIGNKLLPILIIVLVGCTFYALSKFVGTGSDADDPEDAPPLADVMENQPVVPTGTEKNYESIEIAEQAQYLETTQTVAANQATLEKRMDEFEEETVNRILSQVEDKLKNRTESVFSGLESQLSTFQEHALTVIDEKIKAVPKKQIVIDDQGNVISDGVVPPGLGFDDLPIENSQNSSAKPRSQVIQQYVKKKNQDKVVTIGAGNGFRFDFSGDRIDFEDKKKKGKDSSSGLKHVKFEKTDPNNKGQSKKTPKKPEPIPYYTIPVNATLFSNTSLTAIMGVVPVKGVVRNPLRFKLITGPENIATNGLYLPDVKNIVWSGTASGNREMRCARGIVDKVTFTFNDGTIYTQEAADKEGLGYITDKWGKPCIPGDLISNASEYLANRITVAGAASLAQATSDANTTKVQNLENNLVTTITDSNTSEYLAGETLAGSLTELAEYMKDRQLDAVDLVFLSTGQDLTIHVEESINIDYDLEGRRLAHHENVAKISGHMLD